MITLSKNNSIILTWIPSYIGIRGKERVNKKSCKKSLLTDMSIPKILYTDLKPTINKFIHGKNHGTIKYITNSNKIPSVDCWQVREETEVIFSRLCIGHSKITHLNLLKREDTLICSVKHILLNCDSFRQTHPKYNLTSNLKDLFKNTEPKELSFLNETNLFIKI